jgi:hypothetical protein
MLYLTEEQHLDVLDRLILLARTAKNTPVHPAGLPYTSLMICFLMHQMTAAETLKALYKSTGPEWFPRTVGFTIVRPMFEIDITAHYISQSPLERSLRFIEYSNVLNYNQMQKVKLHRNSPKPTWNESMSLLWEHEYCRREKDIENEFNRVLPMFGSHDHKGRLTLSHNWSGLSIKEMAKRVDHVEAYDVFYSDLSSYTHADVHLADSFLHLSNEGKRWTMRAHEGDFAFTVRYAITFLECFLTLFAAEFGSWSQSDVASAWTFPENN